MRKRFNDSKKDLKNKWFIFSTFLCKEKKKENMHFFIESKNNYSSEIYLPVLSRSTQKYNLRFLTSIKSKSVQKLSPVIKG